jgi:cardiolipin synthase
MIRKVVNLPNLLTLGRILITPFIVYSILNGFAVHALVLMVIAGLTDMLDGAIAKHFHMQTMVGAYMDPIADKLMLVGSIISLFIVGQVPMFLFLAVVFRDVIIVIGAMAYELVTRRLEMQPTYLSKVTTVVQIVYVSTALLHIAWPLPTILMSAAAWITFAITCASGVQYMILWTSKATHEENTS